MWGGNFKGEEASRDLLGTPDKKMFERERDGTAKFAETVQQ